MSPTPTALTPLFENIPDELKSQPRWVVWACVGRDGKWRKVPYTAADPRVCASSTNRETWGTFDAARAAYMTQAVPLDRIGFMLDGSGYVAVDLDHVIEDGQLHPEAARIIEATNSYSEISPSGTGIRIMARGSLPPGWRKATKYMVAIELYDSKRYVTITGHRWGNTWPALQDRTAEIAAVHATVAHALTRASRPTVDGHATSAPAPASPTLDDADVLKRALAARNGVQFTALWNGDTSAHNGDDSAADLALCSHLAFWTGRNTEQVDRLFRQSKLMRPKWDSPRPGGTYGAMTIEKALSGMAEQPPFRNRGQAHQEVVRILDLALKDILSWSGRGGASDWAVFLAHCTIVGKAGALNNQASARNVAELARVTSETATKAHRRLCHRGWLVLERRAKGSKANEWRLQTGRDGFSNKPDTLSTTHVETKSVRVLSHPLVHMYTQ